MLLLLVAFVGGLLTVLSPCVLPVLPVLMSGTVGGAGRPLGIIAGFVGSFVVLTLFVATLVNAFGLSPDAIRWGAVLLLFTFGLVLAVPALHIRFELWASRSIPQTKIPQTKTSQRDGFLGGFLIGLTLGVVWTPCVGPILASVITLALSGEITFFAGLVTLIYALGVSLPMFGVMVWGRKLLHRPALLGRLGQIQQVFGVVLLLFALGMVFGVDKSFQTFLVERLPALQQLSFLEDLDVVQKQIEQKLP